MAIELEARAAAPTDVRPPRHSGAYLTYVVVLLAVVNVFNFADRTVISVLMPAMKVELSLSDTQLGVLSGFAFAIFYATLGIPIAGLADRSIRRNIISAALIIWSSMTAICGLAQNFFHLLAARVGVGVGEAGCLPASHSVLGDYFPPKQRSGVLAIHTAGSTVGMMAGLMIGGWLVSRFGWRETFILVGAPGIVLAIVVRLTLKEPARGGHDTPSQSTAGAAEPSTLLGLIKSRPSYIHLAMVFGGAGFVAFGLQQWLPSFYVRSYGMSIAQVGLVYGAVSGLASTVGALGGGYVGDRLLQRGALIVITYAAGCYALAFLFKVALLTSNSAGLSLTFNFFSSLFGLAAHGPVFALIQGVTPPRLRARAAALLTLLTSLIGTGAGPFFIGLMSDLYASSGPESLRHALLWCSAFALWPIVHLVLARRTIEADIKA
ncbi:spinster family MFS transporter [Phenylobacterium sp.]|uniref:spinster family MFS transporter n=1 Tax=Phenylobacterium sp. TaxID=1871053 RepID=UPI0035B06730